MAFTVHNLKLTSAETTQPSAWFEMLLILTIALALSYWVRPENPFFLNESFPWILIAPMLIALRYGFFFGFISVLILLAVFELAVRYAVISQTEIPYTYMIGCVITTMLVGEFRDFWQRRLDLLSESNSYRQLRLDEFTRTFYLLKVSHDRLEQELAGSGQSLREAIRSVQRDIAMEEGLLTPAMATSMLNLFVDYGSLQRCALIGVTKANSPDPEPLANVGGMRDVDVNDPLVQRCLQTASLVAVNVEFVENQAEASQYLLCIPLADCSGRIWAVLVVESLPFFILNDKTLRLLTIIAGHLADKISHQSEAPVDLRLPEQQFFNVNMQRAMRDRTRHHVPAVLIFFAIAENENPRRFVNMLHAMRRGLDVMLLMDGEARRLVWLLLPLTDTLGLEGYQIRLEDKVRQEYGQSLSDLPIVIRRHELSTPAALLNFSRELLLDGEQMDHFTGLAV